MLLNLIITVKDTSLPRFLPSLLFGAYEFDSQIDVLTTAEGFNYYTIFGAVPYQFIVVRWW